MTSRAIQLTRFHALNWYGYRDSIPVDGNLLLAGVYAGPAASYADTRSFWSAAKEPSSHCSLKQRQGLPQATRASVFSPCRQA